MQMLPVAAVVAACLTLATACAGAADPAGNDSTPVASVPSPSLTGDAEPAEPVVRGRDGYWFYGPDFDLACGSGATFAESLRNVERLADVIEESGRRVVWTVAPDKSTVLSDRLPDRVPHDACFRDNQRWQEHVLTSVDDERYVDLLTMLREEDRAGRQVYWRGDSHWTSAGAAHWVTELAERLEPDLVDRIQVTSGTLPRRGDLYVQAGVEREEEAPSATVSTGVTVTGVDGPGTFDPAVSEFGPYRWRAEPADGLLPGRTLLLGDSFSYAAIELVPPIVAEGSFAWFQYFTIDQLARQIAAADTVVIEVVQRTLTHASLADPALQAATRRAVAGE